MLKHAKYLFYTEVYKMTWVQQLWPTVLHYKNRLNKFRWKYSAAYSPSIFYYSWPMFPRWQVDTCKCISCQPLQKTNNLYTYSVYVFSLPNISYNKVYDCSTCVTFYASITQRLRSCRCPVSLRLLFICAFHLILQYKERLCHPFIPYLWVYVNNIKTFVQVLTSPPVWLWQIICDPALADVDEPPSALLTYYTTCKRDGVIRPKSMWSNATPFPDYRNSKRHAEMFPLSWHS